MKKTVLSFTLLLLCVGVFGQTIPNNDFENWETNSDGFEVPVNWGTSNENIYGAEFNTVSPVDTDVYSETYAAKATNVTQNLIGMGDVTLPGIITLGEFVLDLVAAEGSIEGGLPFTDRPYYLKGYFKSAPATGDSTMIAIGLSKWNDTTEERDTIGWGIMYSVDTVDTWTEFEIPIDWTSTENPDSMNIVISPSNLMGNDVFIEGSSVTVDSVWLDYTEPEENNILAVESLAGITVDYGTVFGDIPFPDSVEVTLSNASTENLEVNWMEGSYDGNTQGTYSINGELILTPGILNPNSLMAEVDVTVDEQSAITENVHQKINIYPNPASNLVNIESQHLMKEVTLLDITGRKLITKQVDAKASNINVGSIPEGYYMLHVTTTENDYTVKLIVN
ncbi:MAG: T9SS type A sorting domain-containing protein [Bacteroidales bacterium]